MAGTEPLALKQFRTVGRRSGAQQALKHLSFPS